MSQGWAAVISLGSQRKTASGISPGLTDAAHAPLAARLLDPLELRRGVLLGEEWEKGEGVVCSWEGEHAPLDALFKFYIHGTNNSRQPEF